MNCTQWDLEKYFQCKIQISKKLKIIGNVYIDEMVDESFKWYKVL